MPGFLFLYSDRSGRSMATRCKDFMLGILLGLTITFLFAAMSMMDDSNLMPWQMEKNTLTGGSPRFQPQGAIRMGIVNGTRSNNTRSGKTDEFYPDNDHENDDIARELSRKVRILVWVMTTPDNLPTKAQAIKETWGKRCNVIIYFSSKTVSEFPTVGLDVPEGRNHLTGKTMAAFRYIYENHFHDADWFMKADDDTYVIAENLRYFLSDKDTHSPTYYGHLFKRNVPQGYYSGGSGYVISKEALYRFGTRAINTTICREDGGDEDVEFGICMEKLGIKTSRSVDEMGRSLFHPHPPQTHLLGKFPPWHYRYTAGIPQKGFGVSKYAVSFHYVSPDDMRTLHYFFYHIRPYGIHATCNVSKIAKSGHSLGK
uniref:Glycoprotein-N-acetylgalactosamine 3-beta-galactosyltransferase 1 n=2 Tax=Arion vulgaris TaxID=1028688 RepID=A0A0B7AYV3_9EUPU